MEQELRFGLDVARSGLEKRFILILVQFLEIFFKSRVIKKTQELNRKLK